MKKIRTFALLIIMVSILAFSACDKEENLALGDDQFTAEQSYGEDQQMNNENEECQHLFGDWIVIKESNCKEEGERKRICDECSVEEKQIIEKTNIHMEVNDLAVVSTCKTKGKTEGKHCSVCGLVIVNQIELPLMNHTYSGINDAECDACGFVRDVKCKHTDTIELPAVSPTCVTVGLTKGKKCAKCEDIVVEQTTVAKRGHSGGEWVIERNATCTTDGSKHQLCSICKEIIKVETITAYGHSESEWAVKKEASCTEDGIKYKNCTVCNENIKVEAISAKGHIDGEWIIDKEPTCSDEGIRHLCCSVCKDSVKTETIKATSHISGEWIVEKEATCTEPGSKYQICTVCKERLNVETVESLGGHSYSVNNVENGGVVGSKVTYKCNNCQSTYDKTVEKIVASVTNVGTTSVVIPGYSGYSKTYKITATGGYGVYQYRFEVYTNASSTTPVAHLTQDFSTNNSYGLEYQGKENLISGYILKVTVKDEAGNTTTFDYVL